MPSLIEAAVKKKESIAVSIHLLVDGWRFVTIRKKLLFQFDCEDQDDLYVPKAPHTSPYTRVFFLQSHMRREVAEVIFLNFLGDSLDANFASDRQKCQEYLRAELKRCSTVEHLVDGYRCLFDWCRIGDEPERLPAVWRMFHTPIGELYYVKRLGQDLHDVIHDGINRSINAKDPAALGVERGMVEGMAQGFATKVRTIIERKVQPLSDLMCADVLSKVKILWTKGKADGLPVLKIDEYLAEKVAKITRSLTECIEVLEIEVHEMLPAAMEMLPLGTPPVSIRSSFVHARIQIQDDWERGGKVKLAARHKTAHLRKLSHKGRKHDVAGGQKIIEGTVA